MFDYNRSIDNVMYIDRAPAMQMSTATKASDVTCQQICIFCVSLRVQLYEPTVCMSMCISVGPYVIKIMFVSFVW